MNNEIGRKITSLTLMTIMLAGGMTVASSGMMPVAHAANSNLFVSAENSQFDNYMSGPQVIEVVVINSDINDTDQGEGEPIVTINGSKLRMVQATDGNWYGYFADATQARIADSTVQIAGSGLDFGTICPSDTTYLGGDLKFVSETVGVAVPAAIDGSTQSEEKALCDSNTPPDKTGTDAMNVLREVKEINGLNGGQIGIGNESDLTISDHLWPFIQLYDLSVGGNVNVEYNPGSGLQSTSLTFDSAEAFASAELDRSKYPNNAQVHATITDLWLNIDPTDEDSWTFGTNEGHVDAGSYYQVFDENGTFDPFAMVNISSELDLLLCETNCKLFIDLNAQGADENVLELQDNGDTDLATLEDNQEFEFLASVPVTITEIGPKSGIFGTYDESDVSVLKITSDAARDTSATLEYNEDGHSILVGFDFATIDIESVDDEWNSGEGIPIIIVDGDANSNSRADEDLDLFNPDVSLIPSLSTGTPFTLGASGDHLMVQFYNTIFSEAQITYIVDDNHIDTDHADNVTETGSITIDENGVLSNPPVYEFDSTGSLDLVQILNSAVEDEIVLAVDAVGKRALTGYTAIVSVDSIDSNGYVSELDVEKNVFKSPIVQVTVDAFSDRAIIDVPTNTELDGNISSVLIDLDVTMEELLNTINDNRVDEDGKSVKGFTGFNMFNYDVRSFGPESKTVNIFLVDSTSDILNDSSNFVGSTNTSTTLLMNGGDGQGYISIDGPSANLFDDVESSDSIGLLIQFDTPVDPPTDRAPIVADFFSYGFYNDGLVGSERIANQIIRIEAEESGDNTSTFVGTLEYIMINQLNINDESTYAGISPIADDPTFIVIEDLTDEDSIRVNYLDLGADGVSTQIADQEEAPSHSGVVSFDSDSYKTADTVVITLDDVDLNVDSDLIDIYTVVKTEDDANRDAVGSKTVENGGTSIPLSNDDQLGRLLDVTFDDESWTANNTCGLGSGIDAGLGATGFSLVETTQDSGLFVGSFQIPAQWCRSGATTSESATGLDIEVNYVDFRDASGEIIEVGDSAGVRASTGSVSLDRTVYPVPFGVPGDYTANTETTPTDGSTERSLFPIHQGGMNGDDGLDPGEYLNAGDLTIHIRVNDPDFDISASGEDVIAQDTAAGVGPVKVSVIRGSDTVILTYAGGTVAHGGYIAVTEETELDAPEFGPIDEIAPDAGIFEADIAIRYTDGPASTICPDTDVFTATSNVTVDGDENRFTVPAGDDENYCILQGDILQVEYTDPADASGDVNTVTDSATFDLRNGVLQSDKSVYIIGTDMILTLIEPDFDLDNDQAETYDLDLIEWDSDAATLTMGDAGGDAGSFDPEPLNFRETGDSTGIFQIVVEVPQILGNDSLERGEEIALEYTDWGPSGSNYVGDEDEDVNLTIFTSNFGATVELDQKVYTWTDKVYITIVAPDHNFDGDLVDEIGNSSDYPIRVSTRGFDIDEYKLVETGTDTGIFTGEVILTGFKHDADGDGDEDGDTNPRTSGSGPTDGFLETDDDSGLTVSFEFSDDETVISSSLIRWNIGEVQWLEASYPASGTGVVRVIDPDMNLDPEAVDNFDIDVWSDEDAGGVDLTVTETNEATGIFEGTVFFTTVDQSSGHRLRVAEGGTVTADYEDNTLPDPYATADELNITATTLIGTLIPPLERAPASNLRVVDAFSNSLDTVSVDQQVNVSADLVNGQDKSQLLAYLIQIQDGNGVTVKLDWMSTTLVAGQLSNTSVSWTPTDAGTYTVTAFVWESVSKPTALSPPISTTVSVN